MKRFYALILIAPLVLGACSGSGEKKEETYGGTESHPASGGATQPSEPATRLENIVPELTKAELLTEGGSMRIDAIGLDKDGDAVQLRYKWIVNDQQVSDTETLASFKKGDKIIATVIPFDGKQEGPGRSWVREISNSPPKITPSQPVFNDPTWTLQVNAQDPDGDPLQFSLANAPSGMSIDAKTGLVTWNTSGAAGKYTATIKISDGQGGTTDYPIEVTLSAGQP